MRFAQKVEDFNSLIMTERIEAHLFISGLVQGVFFRSETKRKADEIGVFGWVKNSPDGRVEAILEGEREKVEKLVEWIKKGPTGSRVDSVELEFRKAKNQFQEFEIRY